MKTKNKKVKAKNNGKPYSKEDLIEIRKVASTTKNYKKLSEDLGRTYASLYNKVYTMGLSEKRKKQTPKKPQTVQQPANIKVTHIQKGPLDITPKRNPAIIRLKDAEIEVYTQNLTVGDVQLSW